MAELGLVAIAQIMDLHGENALTRLSIKSHLQKYGLCTCRSASRQSARRPIKIDTKSKAPPPPKQGAVRGIGSTRAIARGHTKARTTARGGGRRRRWQRLHCLRAPYNLAWRLLGGAGLGGWDMLSSLEHLSQLESLAHAMLNGMGMGDAGLGASNLAALSAALSARGLSPQLSAQLSAGFGRLRRGRFPRRPSRPRPQRRQRAAAATSCSSVPT